MMAPWTRYKNLSALETAVADADNSAVFQWLTGKEDFADLSTVSLRSLLRESTLWFRLSGDQLDYYCHYQNDCDEFWTATVFADGRITYVSSSPEDVDEAILAAQTYRDYNAKLLCAAHVPDWEAS